MHGGQRGYRKTARHFAKQIHTMRAEMDERGRGDAADHHEQSDGLVRHQSLPKDQQSQCRAAEHERARVGLTDVKEEHIHAFPKISVSAFHAEQLWQLRARELQRHAGLETDEDVFRDEVHHRTCTRQPCKECDRRRQQCCASGHRAEACRIADRPCSRATSR